MTGKAQNSQMAKQVLGLDLSSLTNGGYVGLIPSRPYKIEGQVNVNIELFEPNATGFREFSKMVKDGADIHYMRNYEYVAPYTLKLKSKADRVNMRSYIKAGYVNDVNEDYFGVGRLQRFSYTKFLLKHIK